MNVIFSFDMLKVYENNKRINGWNVTCFSISENELNGHTIFRIEMMSRFVLVIATFEKKLTNL